MSLFMTVPTTDWIIGLLLFSGLALLIVTAEIIHKRLTLPKESIRKIVHIMSGIAVLLTPLLFKTYVPLLLISAVFTGINLFSVLKSKLNSYNATERKSLGTVYYPLAVIAVTLLFWRQQTEIFYATVALLAFADAAAGLAGKEAPAGTILLLPWDNKSQRGALAMFFASALIMGVLFIFSPVFNMASAGLLISATVGIALLVTAAELLSYRGSDNLSIPAIAALALIIFAQPELRHQFITSVILAVFIAAPAYKLHALDLSGALATFILGALIFSTGGWLFTIPILIFFIVSSALSRLPNTQKSIANEIIAAGEKRNVNQVLANGLAPLACVIAGLIFHNEHAYLLYLAALSAATADTWATEIGLFSHSQPRSIISWKTSAAGMSGGITMLGSFGALAGSALLALAGFLTSLQFRPRPLTLVEFMLIVIAGFLAQVTDSLLGACWQRKNRCCVCGTITERRRHCESATLLDSGKHWLNNDGVNLICGFSALFFVILGCQLTNL